MHQGLIGFVIDRILSNVRTADLSEPITSQQMKSQDESLVINGFRQTFIARVDLTSSFCSLKDIVARSPSKSQRVGWQSKPCAWYA